MSQLQTIFNAFINGALPATTITVVEKVLDNMFTILKIVGDTAAIKLHESLGGMVFDLKWQWQLCQTSEGSFHTDVWEQYSEPVRDAISQFVNSHLPNGNFKSFVPSSVGLTRSMETFNCDASAIANSGASIVAFSGKVFQLDGLLFTIIIGIAIKTLFRVFTDEQDLSWQKFGQDVATTVASGVAVYGAKFALVNFIVYPPAAFVWIFSAVVGILCAKIVTTIIKGSFSSAKK